MKKNVLPVLAMLLVLSLSACLAPRAVTHEERRESIQRMHDEALAQLYKLRPTAEGVIGKAAGYAVFSNVNAQFFFVGGGAGYGLAVNKVAGQKTYMKMAQVDLGLGLGVQDIRAIFVFHSLRAFDDFVHKGWEFGGQADAAVKAGDKGVAATGEISIDAETTVYTLAETGLMAKVNLAGTRYWKDEHLNY